MIVGKPADKLVNMDNSDTSGHDLKEVKEPCVESSQSSSGKDCATFLEDEEENQDHDSRNWVKNSGGSRTVKVK